MSEEEARIEKCITTYLNTLDFNSKLDDHGAKVARAITRGFISLDSSKPELQVEVMSRGRNLFSLTFSQFLSEIDLVTLYRNFLDPRTRAHGFGCITRVEWNPHAATITAEVDPSIIVDAAIDITAARKFGHSGTEYVQSDLRRRTRLVPGSGKLVVNAAEELDLTNIEEAHKASVAEVGVGMLYYEGVMPSIKRRPLAVALERAYKLIFYDMNKEFDVATLFKRTLCPSTRDDFFSAVRSVGLEPRTKTLVMRIGKRQKVNDRR